MTAMTPDKVEAALVERLTEIAYRDTAQSVTVRADDLRAALSTLSVLTEALAERERDAARYRWLREGSVPMLCIRADRHKGLHNVRMMGAEADAAIDAAMKDTDHAR